jgi:SPP1 family predicted phage head-tail adaptor
MVRAGRLRERVTIQEATETRDSFGQAVATWATHATCWASVEPFSGSERFQAATLNAEILYEVRIRYDSEITPKMRLLYGTRILRIERIIDEREEHRELVLLCAEWVVT